MWIFTSFALLKEGLGRIC